MNCNTCTQKPEPVPYIVHESDMARQERTIRRLWILLIIVVVLLVGSNAAWIWYENQWVDVETSNYEIEQDATDGGTNYAVGGDFNGETEDQSD